MLKGKTINSPGVSSFDLNPNGSHPDLKFSLGQKSDSQGEQPFDLKMVSAFRQVMHHATEPTLLIPMLLASPAYHLGKLGAVRGLVAQQGATWVRGGLSLKTLPVAAGFGTETIIFALGSRTLTHHLYGEVPWDLQSIGMDLAMTGMTLGLLKSAGFAGRKATQWARGLDEWQPQLWTKGDHRAMFWTSQASGYLGLVGSHGLQANIFPEMQSSGGNIWMDSLGTHLALGLGSYAGRSLLGSHYNHLERQLGQQAHAQYQRAQARFNPVDFTHGGWAPAGGGLRSPQLNGRPLPENVFAMTHEGDGGESGGAPPRRSMQPTSRPQEYPHPRLEEVIRLFREINFFQDNRLTKAPKEAQHSFNIATQEVMPEDAPAFLESLKSGMDRGDPNSCARVIWAFGQIVPLLEGKAQWEVAREIVPFLAEGLARENSADEVSSTIRKLAGDALERIAAKSKHKRIEGWDEIEKFSRTLGEVVKAFGTHPGLEPAIQVQRSILNRLPVTFQLETAQTILSWHFQNGRADKMRLDFDYFRNSLRLWERTDLVHWLEKRIDEIAGEVHDEGSLKAFWLGLAKELHAKHHRLFEWSAEGNGRVEVHHNAGGFENITQGGLAGYIGLRYLQRQPHQEVDLGHPSVISVRLADALPPGGTFLLESQVAENIHKVGIRAAGDTKDRVQVQWEKNEELRPEIPELLQPLLQGKLTPDSSFNCIPNCVVSGLDNPLGLRLTNHILRGSDGKITFLYQEMEPRAAGIMEQLMAMDELGWWAGAAVSEKKGVTVKFQIRTWERGDAPEKVFVIAQAPDKARRITDVPVWVIEKSGMVLARGSVAFMPHAEAAQKGSGEGADNFRQDLLARLNGLSNTAPQNPGRTLDGVGEIAKPRPWVGEFSQDGERHFTSGSLDGGLNKEFGEVTGTEVVSHAGYAPASFPFLAAFPVLHQQFLPAMTGNTGTAVIHTKESVVYHRPIRSGQNIEVNVTTKMIGKPGGRQVAKIQTSILDADGKDWGDVVLAEGQTTLLIQPFDSAQGMKSAGPKVLSETEKAQLPAKPALVHQVDEAQINSYAGVSGDHNPIHMDHGAAQQRGLSGRIAHGMYVLGLAQRALFLADTHRDPSQPPRFTTDFQGMVRPGDTLRFYVEDFERFDTENTKRPKVVEAGTRVTVLNQRDEVVLRMTDQTPGEQARRVQEGDQVKYLYRKIEYQKDGKQGVTFRDVPIDAQAGIQRVREIVQAMEAKHRLGELPEAPDQPSVTLGVSSGNGLHSAVTEIAFAKLRRGVGVFFEPLTLVAAKNPVQISALENVEGLRVLAAEHSVDYPILYTNAVLPQKDGTVRKLSPKYHAEVQRQRAASEIPDLNLTNSVAFSLHIGPLPGVTASPHVPTLNFMKEGLLEMVRLKEANEEAGRAGTLIPMGENIGAVWQEHQPYYGPRSLSLMATWAGGSQNIEVLPGIYGGGYLGMGKQIGETATLDAHMASRAAGYAQGYFKVVRLPAFNSRALWMIPGGPLMGLISKRVLDKASPPEYPLYKDLTDLAPEVHYKIRSGIHQREHPLAQIELDAAENTYMPEIKRSLDMIYQRVADELPGYREAFELAKGQPWDGKTFDLSLLEQIPNLAERFKERHGREYKPFTYPDGSMRLFDMDATKRILAGLVPENWQELMPAPDSVADKKK